MPALKASRWSFLAARRAARVLRDFRKAVIDYEVAHPENAEIVGGGSTRRPDTPESAAIRERLNRMLPEVQEIATTLEVGQPYLFAAAIDPENGGRGHDRRLSVDAIDQCIGATETVYRRERLRLCQPWWWLIYGASAIVRLPFLILRAAGLPPSVEENTAAHVLKGLATIGLLLLAAAFGVQVAQ